MSLTARLTMRIFEAVCSFRTRQTDRMMNRLPTTVKTEIVEQMITTKTSRVTFSVDWEFSVVFSLTERFWRTELVCKCVEVNEKGLGVDKRRRILIGNVWVWPLDVFVRLLVDWVEIIGRTKINVKQMKKVFEKHLVEQGILWTIDDNRRRSMKWIWKLNGKILKFLSSTETNKRETNKWKYSFSVWFDSLHWKIKRTIAAR